ncbi:MAG: 4-alpha-glucanotransferase [Thermomicrobiales bacterium]
MLTRGGGILLHPTSLPGPNGIGEIGDAAFRFVDWLERAGIRYWQVMPLGPTGYGDSPYASSSAFAGNPLLISLDWLVGDGLLEHHELDELRQLPNHTVDFGAVITLKRGLHEAAFERWRSGGGDHSEAFDLFSLANASWLDDFCLFTALKDAHGGAPWSTWESGLRLREETALSTARAELESERLYHAFLQFQFRSQWDALHAHASDRNVRIVGDIPIFVAYDSVDAWANRGMFQFNEDGFPTVVSGVPPDYFAADGQLWGNPVFDWSANRSTGFAWWVDRVRATLNLVDVMRIDHFRGLAASWSVPADANTAASGYWSRGPGEDVFDAIRSALGEVDIIVEDLGLITADVNELRDRLGYPGMKVLQFAFNDDPLNVYLPHMYESNAVVYTGTHDNDTTIGWFNGLNATTQERVRSYLGHDGRDIAWECIRAAFSSVAEVAIAPLQDVLRLGSEARMNRPGSAIGNWSWRFEAHQLHDGLADGLHHFVEMYGRAGSAPKSVSADPYDYTSDNPAHPLQ